MKKFIVIAIVLVISGFLSLTAIPTAYAALNQFVGQWANVDANTGGITKLAITLAGSNVRVHAWGKCTPTDCDWGQVPGFAYGPNVSANLVAQAQVVTATFETNFSQTIMILRPASGERLQAEVLTRFTDGSGRSAYRGVYVFSRGSAGLGVPNQIAPANGSIFNNFPRTTTLRWSPVSGAARYTVEIDCFHCCQSNKWCTDVGQTYRIVPNIAATQYTFDFVGAQPGRWRVWAISASGQQSGKSPWWEFTYTR